MQFSDHVECNGSKFSKEAANLELEGIVSNRATSLYRSGPLRNWLKDMVESEFVLLAAERDASGVPWALLTREQDGDLEFAGPAIMRAPSHARAEWADKFAAISIDKPALKGLRRANKAQWLKPEPGQSPAKPLG